MSVTPSTSPEAADAAGRLRYSLRTLLVVMTLAAVLSALVAAFGWVTAALVGYLVFVVAVFADQRVAYPCYWGIGAAFALFALLVVVIAVLGFLDPPGSRPRRPLKPACTNNLSLLGRALYIYHDLRGSFPPAFVADEQGQRLHSWRALVLPFIEEWSLYEQYDFSEAWNGLNNSKLHGEAVYVLKCPACEADEDGSSVSGTSTNYVAIVGPGTMWPGEEPMSLNDVKDNLAETILLVEVADSGIHWIEPRDLDVLQMTPAVNPRRGQGISSRHPRGAWVLMADRSVRRLSDGVTPEQLRALLSPAGGERIDPQVFRDR